MAPKDVNVLIPWMFDCYFIWQKGLCTLKRYLTCRDCAGFRVWAERNPKSCHEGDAEPEKVWWGGRCGALSEGEGNRERGERERERKGKKLRCCLWNGWKGLSQGMQAASRTWKDEKTLPPRRKLQKEPSSAATLVEAPSEPLQTFTSRIVRCCIYAVLSHCL